MTIQEQSEFTKLQETVDRQTRELKEKEILLKEARKLAEKYRDDYVSQYEDSAMYIVANTTTKLPWE